MLKEVYNSTDSSEVHLASTLLADHGFHVQVENELTNSVLGMAVGVSLMVPEEEYEAAHQMLVEGGYLPDERLSDEVQEAEGLSPQQKLKKQMMWVLIGLLVLLILFALYSRYLESIS